MLINFSCVILLKIFSGYLSWNSSSIYIILGIFHPDFLDVLGEDFFFLRFNIWLDWCTNFFYWYLQCLRFFLPPLIFCLCWLSLYFLFVYLGFSILRIPSSFALYYSYFHFQIFNNFINFLHLFILFWLSLRDLFNSSNVCVFLDFLKWFILFSFKHLYLHKVGFKVFSYVSNFLEYSGIVVVR